MHRCNTINRNVLKIMCIRIIFFHFFSHLFSFFHCYGIKWIKSKHSENIKDIFLLIIRGIYYTCVAMQIDLKKKGFINDLIIKKHASDTKEIGLSILTWCCCYFEFE